MADTRTPEEAAVIRSLKDVIRAAKALGAAPDDSYARASLKNAYDMMIGMLNNYGMVVRQTTEAADRRGRLLVIRNALARPEAKPYNATRFLIWIEAIQYFAHELGADWPPYPEDRGDPAFRQSS